MLTQKGTQTLQTARLVLRPYRPDDAQPMFDNWANDERVTRFLTWNPHGKPEVTQAVVADWCSRYEQPDFYHWVITLEDVPIGDIGVVGMSVNNESAEIGYCLSHAYWGQGIMTEAARAVIDFLFGEVGLHRLVIRHAVENPASGAVARKCGLLYEGTERGGHRVHGSDYLDIAVYGMLRSDWEALR